MGAESSGRGEGASIVGVGDSAPEGEGGTRRGKGERAVEGGGADGKEREGSGPVSRHSRQ